MMRFATQGLVDNRNSPTNWEERGIIPIERSTPGWGQHPTPPEPAPGWGHHPENQSSNNDFINTRDRVDNYLTASSWITPYRKQWIEHTSGRKPITDPVYRKALQDIILYPERTGLGPV